MSQPTPGPASVLQAIIDASPAPMWAVDQDYRYLGFNSTHAEMMRLLYGTQIAEGSSILDAVSVPEEREQLRTNIGRAIAGEVLSDESWFGTHPHRRYYLIQRSPLLIDGAPAGATVIAIDLTPKADAEMESERLLAIVDSSLDAMSSWTLDGTVLTWNEAAYRLFGYSQREMIGNTVRILLDEAGTDDFDYTLARIGKGERISRLETFGRHKNGDLVAVELTVGPIYDPDGAVIAASGVAHDITGRKQVERALVQSEEKFASAFRASPDSVSINRLADGCYLEVNDGFTAITGYSSEEVIGKTTADIGIWAQPTDRDRLVDMLASHGYVANLETPFRIKDGSILFGLMSARAITLDGEQCVLSITRDVTEMREACHALERSHRQMERMVHQVTESMGRIVEARDPYTSGHQERVAGLSRAMAEELGLSAEEISGVEMAALVHDIGKLSVPVEILTKPGRLSDDEMRLIQNHPQRGHDILSGIAFPWPIAEITLQHHERLDGSGYPRGLHADEILLPARILAVADVVEAMASHRPYRPALGLEAAAEEIRKGRGTLYDPHVADACARLCESGRVSL